MHFSTTVDILLYMTKLLKEAFDALNRLPEDEQERADRAIIDFAAHDGDYCLSDDQVEEVERRMAQKDRTFHSPAQARSRLNHFGI